MATNVFGNPVTNDTVRLVYPHLKPEEITAKHRAEVALLYRTAEGKNENVSKYVHNLKERYGTGTSTLCMIYNATGGNLEFSRVHTWEGQVWGSPSPDIIHNGQWAGFLHVRGRLMGPSKAAVVYHGQNNNRHGCAWMLAWNTQRMNLANRVYNEIRNAGHFDTASWGYIDSVMDRQSNNHSDTWNGCRSFISVGQGSSPELSATMTLDGLDSKFVTLAEAAVSESLDSKYVDDGDDETPAE